MHMQEKDTKQVSASIPEDLYWLFKKVQVDRKESAQQAIENAIRVYIEIAPGDLTLYKQHLDYPGSKTLYDGDKEVTDSE